MPDFLGVTEEFRFAAETAELVRAMVRALDFVRRVGMRCFDSFRTP